MVFKAGQGAGLSGSFFFFSHDDKFLIKTINKKEKSLLVGMLDGLIKHFKKTNNKSLIARVYGLFTIKTNLFANLDVMIMQNTCFKGYTFNIQIYSCPGKLGPTRDSCRRGGWATTADDWSAKPYFF